MIRAAELPRPNTCRRDTPGNTPLLEISGVYAKLECTNPCGSIKDRIAEYILRKSEESGLLRPGVRIVEATSGNTGIALAYFARKRGYDITIVMPENMTDERKQIVQSLGAELILCSAEGSFVEAASIRDRLARENGWFNPDQFSNPLNVECHFETTGEEILRQIATLTARPIDALVAGVGTGGTLMGVGQRLRTVYPTLRLVAVEPDESAVMSGGHVGKHSIYGIGDGFIPAIAANGEGKLHPQINEVIRISSDEAKSEASRIATEYGFCVGISSGANLLAAKQLMQRFATVVTIFADGYAKYQSEGLRHCRPGGCRFEHHPVVAPTPLSD